ncbi:hypothetical protein ElyMa_006732400 [Elysia marginata]|uniref:Uncharacterized protein n=1 Tax=Elysia marginata TaxID=1093978 RepID=A0AAV4IYR1_9GAST|nr:hypothetical protein ElyMa_006732400 [Elysia marginata]
MFTKVENPIGEVTEFRRQVNATISKDFKMAEAVSDCDDDIVIIDEATAEQSLAAKLPTLEAITQAVDQAKLCVDITEKEIALIQEELHKSEDDLGKEVLDSLKMFLEDHAMQASCAITEQDLDRMITEILEAIPPEEFDLDRKEVAALEQRLSALERANHSISKVFLDCHTQLKQFRQLQMEETEVLEKQLAECSDKPILIDDIDADSPSNERILQSTYLVKERAKGQRSPIQSPLPPGKGGTLSSPLRAQLQQQQLLQPGSPATAARPVPAISSELAQQIHGENWAIGQPPVALPITHELIQQQQLQQHIPHIDTLRTHFANTVNESMPGLVSTLQQQAQLRQQLSSFSHQDATTPMAFQFQRPPIIHQPIQWPDLKVQDKVLGKKFNDVWYSGTVMDIAAADPSQDLEVPLLFCFMIASFF